MRRAGGVDGVDPPSQRRAPEIVPAHDLAWRLPCVVERRDLPLELVGEMPRVLWIGHPSLLPQALVKLSNLV